MGIEGLPANIAFILSAAISALLHLIRGSDKDLLSRQGPILPAVSGNGSDIVSKTYEILLTVVLFAHFPWSGSRVNAIELNWRQD